MQPQQKRFLDDTERRLNILFDLLNCDTVPPDTLAQLAELVKGEYSSGARRDSLAS
jgi:protein transport protein SEC31